MKFRTAIGIFILAILSQNVWGQTIAVSSFSNEIQDQWRLLIETGVYDQTLSATWEESRVKQFVEKLKKRKNNYKSPQLFLNYLFYKTHRKFIHNYRQHATVADLLTNGDYDCVSGTAFYAFLLNQLKIEYIVKEFDYHVLLIIPIENETFLFEVTDPLGGFVHQTQEIEERMEFYTKEELPSSINQPVGNEGAVMSTKRVINNNIIFRQLIGLQHFNNAVYFYNLQKPRQTLAEVEKALTFYDSSRINAFKQLTIETFHELALPDPEQENSTSQTLTATSVINQ